MPKPKNVNLERRCKLCELIKKDRNLWVGVHDRILKDGMSSSAVCKWLNSRVETLNVSRPDDNQIKKFNESNFSKHFSKHVTDTAIMMKKLNQALTSESKKETVSFDENNQTEAEAISCTWGGEDSEYRRLKGMIGAMEDNIVAYGEGMEKKRNSKAGLGSRDIENYSKFVSDFLSAKQTLNKLKSSEKSVSDALEAVVKIIVQGLAGKAVGVADEVKETLEAELKDSYLPEEISKLIKARFGSDLRNLATEAVEKVRKEFGIK